MFTRHTLKLFNNIHKLQTRTLSQQNNNSTNTSKFFDYVEIVGTTTLTIIACNIIFGRK